MSAKVSAASPEAAILDAPSSFPRNGTGAEHPRLRGTITAAVAVASVLLVAVVVFFDGINWGLPSRSVEPYLYGGDPPWPGAVILQLGGPWQADALESAYGQLNPLPATGSPLLLNGTAEEQARIIRRYLLYSQNPDELLNFRALASMSPGRLDFDPKLYLYGGLWIYPIGLALALAHGVRAVVVTGNLAYYYDNPEMFARFYVIARGLAALWAILGVWAVFAVTRRLTSGLVIPVLAGLTFIFLPVTINGAHLAKPHGPGAVLILCAVLAAARFVDSGRWRWTVAAGGLCGAAAGMVLWGAFSVVIAGVMVLLRPLGWVQRAKHAAAASAVAVLVYAATNPYVLINAISNRAVIHANVTEGLWIRPAGSLPQLLAIVKIISDAASPPILAAGTVAAVLLVIQAIRRRTVNPVGVLLSAPALVLAAQFLILRGGLAEPDQGRFAALPATALAVAALVGAGKLASFPSARLAVAGVIFAGAAAYGLPYLTGFVGNATSGGTRMRLASQLALEERRLSRANTLQPVLAVYGQPAPYDLPPVDVTRWRVLYLPDRGLDPNGMADVVVSMDQTDGLLPGATPLSFANVTFDVRRFSRAR
jgi:hypothetical protein